MPSIVASRSYNIADIVTSGGTLSIPTSDTSSQYLIYGTATLAGSILINANTSSLSPIDGMQYEFEYNAAITLGSNTLTIFGYSFTAAQALTSGRVVAMWDSIAGVWHTQYYPDFTRTTQFVQTSQLNPFYETLTTVVSFDSSDSGKAFIFLPYKCTVLSVAYSVLEAIAGTDDALLTITDNQVGANIAVITVPQSTAIGVSNITTSIGYNYAPTVLAGLNSHIFVVPFKTTPGGKIAVSILVQRI